MKDTLLLAEYKDTTERSFGVLPTKGAYLFPQAVSPEEVTASDIVGVNSYPFLFNAHEGGQFFVELDLTFDLICKEVDEFHLLLQAFAGEKLHSLFARIPLQMDSVSGAILDTVTNQNVATGTGAQTTFSGYIAYTPLRPSTLTFTAGAVTGTDNGAGVISGAGISSGSIDYATGFWSITYSSAPANLVPITVTYRHSSDVTHKFQFPIFLEKNKGFAIAFAHEHYKGIALTVKNFSIKVYGSYETPTQVDTTGLVTEAKVREILVDYLSKTDYLNPDGSLGTQRRVTWSDILNLPQHFTASPHTHDERYVLVQEFLKKIQQLSDQITETSNRAHDHWNQQVLDGFHEDSGMLFFKGRRIDFYFDYLLNGGKEPYRSWAVLDQDWNTMASSSLDFNSDSEDHGRLMYTNVVHNLQLPRKNYFRIVLSCAYYDSTEPVPANRYKLTRHTIHPIVEAVDENTLRIIARDPSRQPGATVNNARNSGRLWLPAYRVTISALQGSDAFAGHRPNILFIGPLRELP